MHDPETLAFAIRRPWPERAPDGYRYRPALINIWHHDPGGDYGAHCNMRSPRRAWRWHIHHWRITIPPLHALRRRLLTRCAWCHGRHHRTDPVNNSRGSGLRAPWWRGETHLFHNDCLSIHQAHQTCLCEYPNTEYEGYGRCSTCTKYRPYALTPDEQERRRALTRTPIGMRTTPKTHPENGNPTR